MSLQPFNLTGCFPRSCAAVIVTALLAFVLLDAPDARAQHCVSRKTPALPGRVKPVPPPAAKTVKPPDKASPVEQPPILAIPPFGTHLEFNLDWTMFRVRHVDNSSPLEIVLKGSIFSDAAITWTLASPATRACGPAYLSLVEDIMGRNYQGESVVIPLTWEISTDGGLFTAMKIGPDYSISSVFPPGPHTFAVRIRGALHALQSDGFYRLVLCQDLTPLL